MIYLFFNPDLPSSPLESLWAVCPPPTSSTGTSLKMLRISTSFSFTAAAAAAAAFTGVNSLLDLLLPHPTPIAREKIFPLAQTPRPPRLTSQRWI